MKEEIIKELFERMSDLNEKFDQLKKVGESGDNSIERADYLREAHKSTTIFKWSFRAEKVKRIGELKSVLFSDEVINTLRNGFLSSDCRVCESDVISENLLKDLWFHAKKTNNTLLAKSVALISKEKGYVDFAREILVELLVSDFDELISSERVIEDIEFQVIEVEDEDYEDDLEFHDSIS